MKPRISANAGLPSSRALHPQQYRRRASDVDRPIRCRRRRARGGEWSGRPAARSASKAQWMIEPQPLGQYLFGDGTRRAVVDALLHFHSTGRTARVAATCMGEGDPCAQRRVEQGLPCHGFDPNVVRKDAKDWHTLLGLMCKAFGFRCACNRCLVASDGAHEVGCDCGGRFHRHLLVALSIRAHDLHVVGVEIQALDEEVHERANLRRLHLTPRKDRIEVRTQDPSNQPTPGERGQVRRMP